MSAMNALRKYLLTIGATGAALALAMGPVAADEDPGDDPAAEETAEDEAGDADAPEDADEADAGDEADVADAEADEGDDNGKIALAETPRDRIGLIMLGALLVGGWLAASNARRQLKGERPQATGEFRWR
jgi:hypothetical protein